MHALLNKNAPLKCTSLCLKPANHYFTPVLNKLKLAQRYLERVESRSHSASDLGTFHSASNHYTFVITEGKRDSNSNLIFSS